MWRTNITEKKQVFEDVAHPFYWKLKMRILEIYEHTVNQQTFGAVLTPACRKMRASNAGPMSPA